MEVLAFTITFNYNFQWKFKGTDLLISRDKFCWVCCLSTCTLSSRRNRKNQISKRKRKTLVYTHIYTDLMIPGSERTIKIWWFLPPFELILIRFPLYIKIISDQGFAETFASQFIFSFVYSSSTNPISYISIAKDETLNWSE